MGLDNGIYIKVHNKQMKQELYHDLYSFMEYNAREDDEDFDFAYWRKCWNVRRALYDISEATEDNNVSHYTFDSIDDLMTIVNWLTDQFTYDSEIEEISRQEIDDEDNPNAIPDTCKWDRSYGHSYANSTIWSTREATGANMRTIKQLTALYVWLSCHSTYKLHIDYELCWYDSY